MINANKVAVAVVLPIARFTSPAPRAVNSK
jgi:hypothetical protein